MTEAELKLITKGNLKGLESSFVKAEKDYGVNCLFVVAIASLESADGTICFKPNNMFGFGSSGFSSKAECINVVSKDDVAVAKVTVTCNDFSQVSAAYDKAAYEFIKSNLYTDEVADKTALNAKCLDLYVQQIEAASSGETAETVIYLPMVDNGYYGWDVLLSDELMQTMLGGLQMPVSK